MMGRSEGGWHMSRFTDLLGLRRDCEAIELSACSDGFHQVGSQGVEMIVTQPDRKVEYIVYSDRVLAYVKSASGYPAYYPVEETHLERPVKAVLMDLDGTTVKSESFWMWIIEMTCQSLMGDSKFSLEESDIPHVSGHSVTEHLLYCINKYCPGKSLAEARNFYFEHTHREMKAILEGRGRVGAFTPAEGVKDFLMELKGRGIRLGLVTSGLYEKAYPEILSAFETLGMGKPEDFYDCIISAGYPLQKGSCGTLGELSPKPHPWLYAETGAVGLGMERKDRHHVVGIEDSAAGIHAIKLAGYVTVGIGGGNIEKSGTVGLCNAYCQNFSEILDLLFGA